MEFLLVGKRLCNEYRVVLDLCRRVPLGMYWWDHTSATTELVQRSDRVGS